ncbi:hypothetical protein [Massilia pseudoviolaceinigra]|nr:hypothetical protein [Massilia sp. CCM 9206]
MQHRVVGADPMQARIGEADVRLIFLVDESLEQEDGTDFPDPGWR